MYGRGRLAGWLAYSVRMCAYTCSTYHMHTYIPYRVRVHIGICAHPLGGPMRWNEHSHCHNTDRCSLQRQKIHRPVRTKNLNEHSPKKKQPQPQPHQNQSMEHELEAGGLNPPPQHQGEIVWFSRTTFLVTAIAAGLGFGSIWRFPALAHEYGGGIVFVPCFLALTLIGFPLLLLEISMGQHLQRSSDVSASGHLSKHFRGVGVASIFVVGLGMLSHCYVPLISWCLRIWLASFRRSVRTQWDDVNGTGASIYFLQEIIRTTTLDDDQLPSRMSFMNILMLLVTWGLIRFCLESQYHGYKWNQGKIIYFTMGFPMCMLLALVIRTTTLSGSDRGVSEYVRSWEWSVLMQRPDIWSKAVSQIFLSLGVSLGVMSAFGSRCAKRAPAFQNSLIISATHWTVSFLSGLCVFGVLGYLTEKQGDYRVEAGPALLFGIYPAAFSTIPGGLHWIRFLFFSFVLLGLNTAFAMVEGMVSVIEDSALGKVLPRTHLVSAVCVIGFVGGLLSTTDVALHFMDTVDFYLSLILLFLGFCKAFSAGWMYNIRKQIKLFGYNLIYVYLLASFGSIILASLVWFGVSGNTFLLGLICFVAVYGMGVYYCYEKLDRMENTAEGFTLRVLCDEIIMGNILDLRADLEGSVGYIPYAWAVLMKHVIPQVLLILFFNLAFSRTDHGRWALGEYADYRVWPFQILGLSLVVIVFGTVGVGLVKARLFDVFIDGAASKPEPTDEDDNDEDEDFEMVDKDPATNYVEMPEEQVVVVGGSGELMERDALSSSTEYRKMPTEQDPSTQQQEAVDPPRGVTKPIIDLV